ncbi:MAG: regulator [Naasia sp.]|nr:regulator [Naasia sp.]
MRLVLCLAPDVEDRILADAVRAGHEVAARPAAVELPAVLQALHPDAAVVAANALDAAIRDAADTAGTRLVAVCARPDGRSRVAALGIREAVDESASWSELARMLDGDADAPAPAAPPRRRGRVIAVWGPTGAPGRTTVAITLAAEAALAGERVLLVDADTRGASVAPALGLLDEAPGFAAACRLAGTGRLDAEQLERVAEPYELPGGAFTVLTGIARTSRWPELSAERVTAVLRLCREEADAVLIDVGFELDEEDADPFAPRRNAATLAALREADLVVAVGAADPVGLARFLRAHADLVEVVDADQVRVVIMKVRSSAVGLAPASQIAATLLRFGGIADAALVPSDGPGCDAALLAGRTLQEAAPRSAALAALRGFARRELLPAPAGRVGRRRRWQLLPLG